MHAPPSGATRRRVCGLTLAALGLLAGASAAADPPAAPYAAELARIRRIVACDGAPTDDAARDLTHRGRAATAITGRERAAAEPGPIRDFSVFDAAAGRIVSHVCFANASQRGAGEPIMSLSEVSTHADAGALALLPGAALALESIQRYRTSGQEAVYYEARYAPTNGEPPFLEAPVRLLLNASTGTLLRFDVDPDWLDPDPPPRLLISRAAAERIATVVLDGLDLATTFGAGASVAKVGPAELFMVRANAALGPAAAAPEGRARQAWVVPFRLGGAAAGTHELFVDAATGKVLGGSAGLASAPPSVDPSGMRDTR